MKKVYTLLSVVSLMVLTLSVRTNALTMVDPTSPYYGGGGVPGAVTAVISSVEFTPNGSVTVYGTGLLMATGINYVVSINTVTLPERVSSGSAGILSKSDTKITFNASPFTESNIQYYKISLVTPNSDSKPFVYFSPENKAARKTPLIITSPQQGDVLVSGKDYTVTWQGGTPGDVYNIYFANTSVLPEKRLENMTTQVTVTGGTGKDTFRAQGPLGSNYVIRFVKVGLNDRRYDDVMSPESSPFTVGETERILPPYVSQAAPTEYYYPDFVHMKKNTQYKLSVRAYASTDGTGSVLAETTYHVTDIASVSSRDRASWPQVTSPTNTLQLAVTGSSLGMEGTTGLMLSWRTPKGLSVTPGSYTISSVEYANLTGQPKAEVVEKVVLATSGAVVPSNTTTPTTLTVTSPNGGETWVVGSTQKITYALPSGTVISSTNPLLVYVEREGTMWRICKQDTNATSCSYTVEQAMLSYFKGPTTGFRIKVCAGATCTNTDSSDGVINIINGVSLPGTMSNFPTPAPSGIDTSKYVLQINQREILIRGYLQSVSGDSFVIRTHGGTWTANISPNTEYVSLDGRRPILKVGDYVGVRGLINATGDYSFTTAALRNRTLYP